MRAPIIRIDNLKKSFNGKVVLDSINLEIYQGELFGIVGSSGSGKTTLLNSMIGFLEPDFGEILLKEANSLPKSVSDNHEAVKKSMGFAAQQPSFYPRLTVLENLDYFGSLYDLPREARLANARTLIKLVSLEGATHTLAENLSGGMERRLDIACSLIHDPSILILDEPTSNLDPLLSKHIWNLLQKINKKGTTVIVASHEFSEIESICSRIGIIADGKLLKVGTIQELTNNVSRGQEIHIETYPGNYEKILKNLNDPLIITKENRGNKIVLATTKPDKILKKILNLLSALDENLMDVSITKYNLNDVFLKMANRK